MDNKKLRRSVILALILSLIALVSLSAATYAWFTAANRRVVARRVESQTSNPSLSLLVSETTDFSARRTVTDIRQVNSTDSLKLMPVSTSDLQRFCWNPRTDSGLAAAFIPVEGEQYYYHGRIYLLADAREFVQGSLLTLYLDGRDGEGGQLISGVTGDVINASRLGLVFSEVGGGITASRILNLSDADNQGDRGMNTVIDGVLQQEGIVLHTAENGTVTAVADPSEYWQNYEIRTGQAAVPKPLTELKLGTVYALDIFFYLEGCDADCVEGISQVELNGRSEQSGLDLALWFYGLLA